MSLSRRKLMRGSVLASASALSIANTLAEPDASRSPASRLRVLVAGGHPGDPECGCAGTIARYSDLGHDVVILYLNHGEGYCGPSPLNQCGSIRTAEAQKACEILKAHPLFANQIDSHAILDNAHYSEFQQLLEAQRPDAVFTQWPIDQHSDHRAISALCLNAWVKGGQKFTLYYYEVADDTLMFSPSEYVDISNVEDRRHAACYAHASQSPDKWYPAQTRIARFRGSQCGYTQAEAFIRQWEGKAGLLPE
jgi:N-acetylglucosamine malate deacetylase 1